MLPSAQKPLSPTHRDAQSKAGTMLKMKVISASASGILTNLPPPGEGGEGCLLTPKRGKRTALLDEERQPWPFFVSFHPSGHRGCEVQRGVVGGPRKAWGRRQSPQMRCVNLPGLPPRPGCIKRAGVQQTPHSKPRPPRETLSSEPADFEAAPPECTSASFASLRPSGIKGFSCVPARRLQSPSVLFLISLIHGFAAGVHGAARRNRAEPRKACLRHLGTGAGQKPAGHGNCKSLSLCSWTAGEFPRGKI